MKKIRIILVLVSIIVALSCSKSLAEIGDWRDWETWGADNTISGALTVDNVYIDNNPLGIPGLAGSGPWSTDPDTLLTWSVTAVYNEPGTDAGIDYFTYTYTFTEDISGDLLSHFILEVSDPFSLDDPHYFGDSAPDLPSDYLKLHSETGMPNPGGTGDGSLYGIKFEPIITDEDGTWTVTFDSRATPMWGDFWGKDGSANPYLYNTGFGYDPYTGNNLSLYGYIVRPDTWLVPTPTAVILGILGLTAAGIRLRKYA